MEQRHFSCLLIEVNWPSMLRRGKGKRHAANDLFNYLVGANQHNRRRIDTERPARS